MVGSAKQNNKSSTVKISSIPMRDIDFQVDTVSVERADNVGGYMSFNENTITSNFIKGDSEWNEWAQGDNLIIHEQKHRDNNKQGLYEYPVSPEQAYKLNMYDEISANMASLLLLRQKYLETGDISIFDKTELGRFSFYKEAIEGGEINPRSNTKKDFDKEMRFIANGTKDMWMQEFSTNYVKQNSGNGYYYGDKTGKYAQYYDQNYERGKKIALTIGGVDFSQYLNKDVEIPEKGKIVLNNNLGCLRLWEKNSNREFTKKTGLPAYDGSMSLRQYQNYLQHYMVVNNIDPDALRFYSENLVRDKQTGTNFNARCQDSINKLKKDGMEVVENNKELIETAVRLAAKDYVKNGKKLPKDNPQAYQKALNNLYSTNVDLDTKFSQNGVEKTFKYKGNVNFQSLLGVTDKELPQTSLSAENRALEKQSQSFVARCLNKWSNFCGVDATASKAYVEASSNWDKFKAACKGFYNITKESVVNKFSSKEGEAVKNEAVKNEVINPVDKNKKPEYRQWEDKDGSRVSEVQHISLPDMTKDVIQKPSNYNAESKVLNAEDASREKMCAIIDYMNKINGQGKTIDAEKTVENLRKTYGDKALSLLQIAVNEPANYAKYVGDASIKTSRAAVQHLCNIKEPEKAAQEIAQRKVSPKYESSVKEQLKNAQQSNKKQTSETKSDKTAKQQMKEAAQKLSNQKKMAALQQKTVAKNDNIPTRQQLTQTVEINSRSVQKRSAANKIGSATHSFSIRKQRTND